jgi:hypothetical protein
MIGDEHSAGRIRWAFESSVGPGLPSPAAPVRSHAEAIGSFEIEPRRGKPQRGGESMQMNAARRAMMALAMAGFTLGGCDSKPHYEHAKVHGKVTYQGKPVPLGSVLFVPVEPPKEGSMQPASGSINPDGTYELKSEEDAGAILGEHKVVVIAVDGGKPAPAPDATKPADSSPAPSAKSVQFKSLVPKKYSDPSTTPLTRKVVAGDNTIDLELGD